LPFEAGAWRDFEGLVAERLAEASLAVFSGSLPIHAPADSYARLIARARSHSTPALVDTRGDWLRSAAAAGPYLVKINANEASELVRQPVRCVAEAVGAARDVRALGVEVAVITLGELGAVAVSGSGTWHAALPSIAALSPVGSGDTLLGGLAVGLQSGQNLPEALALGVAAGSANALTLGAGVCQLWTVTHELCSTLGVSAGSYPALQFI
jgi:fructose-1-phosphate kinase PfkB-like protein